MYLADRQRSLLQASARVSAQRKAALLRLATAHRTGDGADLFEVARGLDREELESSALGRDGHQVVAVERKAEGAASELAGQTACRRARSRRGSATRRREVIDGLGDDAQQLTIHLGLRRARGRQVPIVT